jgi:OOP family OmpA-OmpF porin
MLKTLLVTVAAACLLGACETPPPVIAASAPQPQQQARTFVMFFEFERSTLTTEALGVVREAADAAKSGKDMRLTTTGHTDTAGSASYNMALSLRRAAAVKDALMGEGVPAASIAIAGSGEEGLEVATGDGARESRNRRVEILVGQ